MRGIVFSTFIAMVEDHGGLQAVDTLLEKTGLDGVYTSVGAYPDTEMVELVTKWAEVNQVEVPDALVRFGRFFFEQLLKTHADFFPRGQKLYEMLLAVDGHIHEEVKKLYPGAEPPRFDSTLKKDHLEMIYISERGLSDFAHGLIARAAEHYQEPIQVEKEDLSEGRGVKVLFRIYLSHERA